MIFLLFLQSGDLFNNFCMTRYHLFVTDLREYFQAHSFVPIIGTEDPKLVLSFVDSQSINMRFPLSFKKIKKVKSTVKDQNTFLNMEHIKKILKNLPAALPEQFKNYFKRPSSYKGRSKKHLSGQILTLINSFGKLWQPSYQCENKKLNN